MADVNHFYSIRRQGDFNDLTPQILALGLKTNMNKLKLIDANSPFWHLNGQLLKKREGTSIEGRNPLTGFIIKL
ncbi:hypothetical protein EZ449_03580 [Pedobacter frigidisoli]|uniref:Uncharacterized protein n=1 Tax=Pedobacter frigidisoli TaxID=2530455 RepID=A0A4R0P8V0_9SPHI|nr:hypothetical protein [Pedobacter frigidisoli]TCD12110.1 hypothetical protein EZ449_03580 [Pedobacter frigidisoli]